MYPSVYEEEVDVLSLELRDETDEDLFLRMMELPLYEITLPFVSLAKVVLCTVDEKRQLCLKPRECLGFSFQDNGSSKVGA